MAISYNTGTTANVNNAVSVAFTIPSGVLTNDVMFLNVQCFTEDASTPTVSFSGGGGTWTAVSVTTGTNPENSNNSSIYNYGYAYYRVATAGDPGATLTVTESGSAGATTWFAVALASYTGASTSSPVDVAGGSANAGNTTTTLVTPSETTGVANDWAVYLFGGGINGSGSTTMVLSSTTQRQAGSSSAGIGAAINDSNGSVGPAGAAIGGGTWTVNDGNGWLTAFTIGLAPPQAATGPQATIYPDPPQRVVTQVIRSGRMGAGHS